MLNAERNSVTELDPRQCLMSELERRCGQNPKYSLRAFAKALSIHPATLSMVLSGKRQFSKKMAERVAKKLALDPLKSTAFVRGATGKFNLLAVTDKYEDLSLDKFATISDWYHYGILSLITTKGFQTNFSWIASRLGISTMEAKAATERLVRLGVLDTSSNPWRQVGGPIMIENNISTSATRHFQSQVLKMAQYSLENDSPEVRDISSVTVAVDPAQLSIAIEEIRKFRIHLMKLLEKQKPAQEVYHLAIQLYPVSRKKK
jgi:uncharacterized protein (TIGR02147 family)